MFTSNQLNSYPSAEFLERFNTFEIDYTFKELIEILKKGYNLKFFEKWHLVIINRRWRRLSLSSLKRENLYLVNLVEVLTIKRKHKSIRAKKKEIDRFLTETLNARRSLETI